MHEAATSGEHPGAVSLWFAYPGDLEDSSIAESWAELLPDDELARLHEFRFERDRRQYLAAHALLRMALSSYSGCNPRSWRFTPGIKGKPAIDPPSGLHFNISHTIGLVACAISTEGEIGIDIESFGRAPDVLAIKSRVFSRQELEGLESFDPNEKQRRTIQLWTFKEAYTKALGRGLSLRLNEISLSFPPASADIQIEVPPEIDSKPQRWTLGLLEHEGCSVAMVFASENERQICVREVRDANRNFKPLVEPALTCFQQARS